MKDNKEEINQAFKKEGEVLNTEVKGILHRDSHYLEDYAERLKQEDGYSHIRVDLRHGNKIFEQYSSASSLSDGIFEYIEGVAKYTKIYDSLAIDFILTPEDTKMESLIEREFKENYAFELDDSSEELHRCSLHSLLMTAFGVLLLSIYIAMSAATQINSSLPKYLVLIAEVISIASWVFIWDAVDKFFFERPSIKRKRVRFAQIANSEVNFVIKDEKDPWPLVDEKKGDL